MLALGIGSAGYSVLQTAVREDKSEEIWTLLSPPPVGRQPGALLHWGLMQHCDEAPPRRAILGRLQPGVCVCVCLGIFPDL